MEGSPSRHETLPIIVNIGPISEERLLIRLPETACVKSKVVAAWYSDTYAAVEF